MDLAKGGPEAKSYGGPMSYYSSTILFKKFYLPASLITTQI